MQREYGWSFGAVGEPLTFDGRSQQRFKRGARDHVGTSLSEPRLRSFSSSTLFQSTLATPTTAPDGDSAQVTPLRDALRQAILGAKLSRSGSWNRAFSGS